MKKMIVALTVITALSAASSVHAENLSCSVNGQYGGSVCGVSTSTDTTVVHTVGAGISDMSLAQIIGVTGLVALAATALYKLTYRSYILG